MSLDPMNLRNFVEDLTDIRLNDETFVSFCEEYEETYFTSRMEVFSFVDNHMALMFTLQDISDIIDYVVSISHGAIAEVF